ncbi:MAG: hypothetical protein M3220_05715 [Chloroflexota bacterium]|nr:hypothetical protein [Chloroflexota bacterium]
MYIGSALVVPSVRYRLSRQMYMLLILLSSVVAFLFTLLVVQLSSDSAVHWVMSSWKALTGAGDGLRFRVDRLGASFLLLVGLVGIGTLVGSLDEKEEVTTEEYQAGSLALLGGLAAFGLADNLLTLLSAGLLLDTALIYSVGLSGHPRWLLAIFLHGLGAHGATLAAMLLLWWSTGSVALADANEPVVWLLILAATLRMAPLPLSLFPIAFERLPQRVLAVLPLVTLGVGSVWLGRIAQAIAPNAMPDLDGLAGIAALGVALGGWVAWRREEPSVRLMILSAVQAAWTLWAFAWGFPTIAVATAWGGALALAALAFHGGRLDFRHGAQLPGLIAALMLVGFPGSALWNTATMLSKKAWVDDAHWLLTLGVIAMMTVTVTLFEWMLPEETEPHQQSRWIGAILLASLSVPFVARLWGIRIPELVGVEQSLGPLVAQVALVVTGWTGGLLLWRNRARFHSLHPLLDTVASFFSFVWLWRIVGRIGWLLLSGVRGMMLVLEGENYAWLLLFLFVTLILLLSG